MKKIKNIFAIAILVATATTSSATTFNYTYTFGSGAVITGSFSGTANANLITDLFDITASMNGTSLFSPLYGLGYKNTAPNQYMWTPNEAVASFDGTQNQFMFADNSMEPGHTNLISYFYIVTSIIDGAMYPEAFATLKNDGINVELDGVYGPAQYDSARWSLVTVPLPAAAWHLATGLFCIAGLRRTQVKNARMEIPQED